MLVCDWVQCKSIETAVSPDEIDDDCITAILSGMRYFPFLFCQLIKRMEKRMLAKEDVPSLIRVIDDVNIPANLRRELTMMSWQPIWANNWTTENYEYKNWGALFMGDSDATSLTNCEHEMFTDHRTFILGKFWRIIKEHYLPGHELLRYWALAFTHGMDGHIHIDGKEEDYYTTLLYIHPVWQAGWGGELLYYDEAMTDIAHVVVPKPLRVVIAPGHIPHRISPPTRDTDQMRGVLGFRSRLRRET
jgi:hypothetical protein